MFLNFDYLKNPVNWVTVWLMVAIGVFVFHILFQSATANKPVSKTS